MIEDSSRKFFLNTAERLKIMEYSLQRIIDVITEESYQDEELIKIINDSLGEFIIHLKAMGPDIILNLREQSLLKTLLKSNGASFRIVAQRCAHFLGILKYEDRYKISWREEPIIVKNALLKDVQRVLGEILNQPSSRKVLELEELIIGFEYHENPNSDIELMQFCSSIRDLVSHATMPESSLNLSKLAIKHNIAGAMIKKLNIALS